MALPRESTFMPTIKCSSCGNQVEISMMGDHVCDGTGGDELSPPPDTQQSFYPPLHSKFGRTAPPQVDTSAANRPYMHRGQLTPVSQPSDSRSTSPVVHNGGPSPSLTDDVFATRSPAQARRPGGYGGFGRADDDAEVHDGALGRMQDRIKGLVPGPFDTGLRPATSHNTRQESLPSPDEMPRIIDYHRPGTSPGHDPTTPVLAPPKVPRKNGYGGFGPPASIPAEPASPSGYFGRSDTYPLPSPRLDPPKRLPSAPGSRPRNAGEERKQMAGPDRTRKPPPRISLLTQHRPKHASSSVDVAAEFGIGNPYHSSMDSASSGLSPFGGSYTSPISMSTATSPARSQANPESPRLQKAMEQKLRIGSSPRQERYDPAIQAGQTGMLSPSTPSPRKKQGGGFMGLFRDRDREREREKEREREMERDLEREREKEREKARTRYADPLPGSALLPAAPPAVLPYRGECKACGLAIRGKSISSADGRLTGKYHKACFVCTTCTEPFLSTEFYVLGDRPYCEQHYHKLNGSLCGSCGRGIEGQYLEDEARTKYHLGCFRCLDCDMSLVDGYFEVDGRAYCERDAWRRSAPIEYDTPSPRTRPPPKGPAGLPGRPGPRPPMAGSRPPPVSGKRLGPGMGFPPRPRMNKRMTRLGQM